MPVRVPLLLMLLVTAGCATTGTARPSPFPGAPPPPGPVAAAPPAAAPPPGVIPPPPSITATPIPGSGRPSAPAAAEAVVDTALAYRGVPYILGGDDPRTGFDCSGLVRYVFAAHAIVVPRTVAEQYRIGIPVKLADLEPGDLVFFSTTGRGATHVGIAVSRDEFVHAPNSKGVVRVEPVDSPYWHDRFVGARRVSALHRGDPLQ